MFVVRNGRLIEIEEMENFDGVVLEKKEHDLGTREDALAEVDRQIAAVNLEKNAVLEAGEGEASIPRTREEFARKNYFYLVGGHIYSCYCEYDQDGHLKTMTSKCIGLKEELIQKYNAMLVDLNTRYQGILNAVEE